MGWFTKLKTRVLVGAGADAPLQASQPPLREQRLLPDWAPEEIDALLDAARYSRLCYATCEQYNAPLQSVVLAFDMNENQLLLDEFFPSPATGLIDTNLTLTLSTPVGALYLEVKVTQRVTFAGGPALVARVYSKGVHPDIRQSARVAFAKGQAPAIELLLPMTPLMRGHVVDLSPNGLLMCCPSARRPNLFTHKGECKVMFDEHFRLRANVRIQHARFIRKPFRHSMLRVAFCNLPADQKEQLAAFLVEFESATAHRHRAA